MRTTFVLGLAIALGACGNDGSGDSGDGTNEPDAGGPDTFALTLQSPDTIEIFPGQEITYCWYFRTPNTKMLAIKRWMSSMTAGSHHLIMYTTQNDVMEPGTVSTVNCGPGSGLAMWTYSAQTPEADLAMPADDGEGKPVAMEIAPNTPGFLQMHYLNSTDEIIQPRITVTAEALDEGVAFTKTAAFVTFNGNIAIPPMTTKQTPDVETMTCNVPGTSKFWLMSTHAHKRAVRTIVKDGNASNGTTIFESTDWEHPGATRWDGPFYQFGTGKLTYECSYFNETTRTIRTGESAQTDEMCMASGYFFPATRPVFCYNNITI
jgi:hypothetical protein